MSQCDKCKTDVPVNNDASIFDAILTGNPIFAFAMSRHLLPVFDGDEMVCSGSPSRAQYIEGQPRDPRGEYVYHEELEPERREAFEALQQVTLDKLSFSGASAS